MTIETIGDIVEADREADISFIEGKEDDDISFIDEDDNSGDTASID
jgi:hypothetical protein